MRANSKPRSCSATGLCLPLPMLSSSCHAPPHSSSTSSANSASASPNMPSISCTTRGSRRCCATPDNARLADSMSSSIIITAQPSSSDDEPRCGLLWGAAAAGLRLKTQATPRFKFLGEANAEGGAGPLATNPRLRWFQVIALWAICEVGEGRKLWRCSQTSQGPKTRICIHLLLFDMPAEQSCASAPEPALAAVSLDVNR